MEFRLFLEQSESYSSDIKKTLRKLPKSHRALLRGYTYKFQPGNTLENDNGHVGLIDEEKKTITVAAPWNYGREFTLLHEIAHMIWKYVVDDGAKKKWSVVAKKHKDRQRQNEEELFCMAYANTYCKNKVVVHDHPQWEKFIKTLP